MLTCAVGLHRYMLRLVFERQSVGCPRGLKVDVEELVPGESGKRALVTGQSESWRQESSSNRRS